MSGHLIIFLFEVWEKMKVNNKIHVENFVKDWYKSRYSKKINDLFTSFFLILIAEVLVALFKFKNLSDFWYVKKLQKNVLRRYTSSSNQFMQFANK